MRILWIAPVPYVGDENAHPAPWIATLGNALVQAGHELTILNYNYSIPESKQIVLGNGIKYVYLKTPKPKADVLSFYSKRIKIINEYLKEREFDFDIIHVHGTEHQYESSLKGIKTPIVLSMQGVMKECYKVLPKNFSYTHLSWMLASMFESWNIKKVGNFICRTHFDSNFVRSNNPSAIIHKNWEMIRPQFFQDNFSEKPEKILFIGGTHPIKGIREMLIAFNAIRAKHKIILKLLGGIDRSVLAHIITKYNLKNIDSYSIELVGFQNVLGVVDAFRECFCLVHPSYIDNSPNSVCEAQVSGLPVIASNVGGVASLIQQGETGLLVDVNPRSIEDAVNLLIEDPEIRSKLSNHSKRMARLRHHEQTILSRTITIYDEVIEKNHSPHESNLRRVSRA